MLIVKAHCFTASPEQQQLLPSHHNNQGKVSDAPGMSRDYGSPMALREKEGLKHARATMKYLLAEPEMSRVTLNITGVILNITRVTFSITGRR